MGRRNSRSGRGQEIRQIGRSAHDVGNAGPDKPRLRQEPRLAASRVYQNVTGPVGGGPVAADVLQAAVVRDDESGFAARRVHPPHPGIDLFRLDAAVFQKTLQEGGDAVGLDLDLHHPASGLASGIDLAAALWAVEAVSIVVGVILDADAPPAGAVADVSVVRVAVVHASDVLGRRGLNQAERDEVPRRLGNAGSARLVQAPIAEQPSHRLDGERLSVFLWKGW